MRINKTIASSVIFLTATDALELAVNNTPELDNMVGVDLMSYYNQTNKAETDQFEVHDVYMRKDNNFLQGLYWCPKRKQFLESAGLYLKSKVEYLAQSPENDRVEVQDPDTNPYIYDKRQFGEGLCPRNEDELVVLTWRERKILILDRNTLEEKETFEMDSRIKEGWGITEDQTNVSDKGNYRLYVSDGTSNLFEVDGDNMEILNQVTVVDQNGNERDMVNELEFINGSVYANIWYENDLVKINPKTGVIEKSWDIGSIADAERNFQVDKKGSSEQDCLNGIAYNPETERVYLSGKNHHLIFEVSLN